MHTQPKEKDTPFKNITDLAKWAVFAFVCGFLLHAGEYTAEQIWPTPPITIEYKATK